MRTIDEINDLVEKCRAAEANLATLRQTKEQATGKFANADTLAVGSAVSADAINVVATKLAKSRREIDNVSYQIDLNERNLTQLHSLLRNRSVNLLGEARDRFEAFRRDVRGELLRRVGPFLHPQNINGRFPDGIILPLDKANTWFQGMAGHVDGLKNDPVNASLLLRDKFQALLKECAAREEDLGIQSGPSS